MSATLLIVDAASGLVLNLAAVDDPSTYTAADGQVAVDLASAKPAGVTLGWVRQADGSFNDPDAPGAPTPADLLAYAADAHLTAEAKGTTWNGWPVMVSERAMTILNGELNAISLGVRQDGEAYLFADGPRPLTNDQVKSLSVQVRSHVKAGLLAYLQVQAGITASPPTITTTAQIDAAFAAVT